jgi:hypothetical protein
MRRGWGNIIIDALLVTAIIASVVKLAWDHTDRIPHLNEVRSVATGKAH